MTDEPLPGATGSTTDETTSTATVDSSEQGQGEFPSPPVIEESTETGTKEFGKESDDKLDQTVEMLDVGPCKKHIKVTVARSNIDKLLNDKFSELVKEAVVPGFRPGKAPRKVITRRYHKEVTNQVRGQLLMASLEQLAKEQDVAPLAPPQLDPDKIVIPEDGPFVYEFDVEVRPEFDLPEYKGLKLKRPTRAFTDDDVAREERRLLAGYGQLVPKEEGTVEPDNYITVDAETRIGGTVIGTMKEAVLRVDDRLVFKDGIAENFAEKLRGAKIGDKREVDIVMSDAVALPQLRGQTVKATIEIKDVKQVRLPELTHEFLHNFGFHTPDQLREYVRVRLDKRLEYQQRQSAREQILALVVAASDWDLPRDLLVRQARKHLARKVLEMKEAGLSNDEIRARERLLQQDVVQSTAMALKEHFVMQKIAEVEKIDITEDEINGEIDRLADLENESPRRVRARLEKEDMLETLAAQIVERKVVDLILSSAEFEDVQVGFQPSGDGQTVDAQAVEGQMHDPTAVPSEEEKPGEEQAAASAQGENEAK